MYASGLRLQLVDRASGDVVDFPGGVRAEVDFAELAAEAIVKRGVGVLRSEAHVREDIIAGLAEAFTQFKLRTAGTQKTTVART